MPRKKLKHCRISKGTPPLGGLRGGGVPFLEFFRQFLCFAPENFFGTSLGYFWYLENFFCEVGNFCVFSDGLKIKSSKKAKKHPKKCEVFNFKMRYLV